MEPTTTRENFYVSMTRGRNANRAYVVLDQPDDHRNPHPGDNPDATARSVLYGILLHVGAELSARETIAAEQDRWGSIAQLAAEYETIAAAAQHDRWATLIRRSGLTTEQADAVIDSDAFGALTAELRRAEANSHNVDALLPKLVRARGFTDAQDIASVLHHRVERATARPAGSGRTRTAPHLIAGLIPEANGPMSKDMRDALDERRDLIEARGDAVLDRAINDGEAWVKALGPIPKDARSAAAWRQRVRVVAAYRDRYGIAGTTSLEASAETEAQKIDAVRARVALMRVEEATRRSADVTDRRSSDRTPRGQAL